MPSEIRCALRGCGRMLTEEQARNWRHHKKVKKAGPFCSLECYWDHRKTPRGKRCRAQPA